MKVIRYAFVLLLAFTLLLTACAPQPTPAPAPQQPIIINVPQPAAPQQQQQQQTVIVNPPAAQPPAIVPVPFPVPGSGWCGELRGSALSAGMTVHVTYTPDQPNVLRTAPTKNSGYLGALNPGGRAYLLDGPYCDRGVYIYWHVSVIDTDDIYNHQRPRSQYGSVYTAETDIDGLPWLAP